MEHPDTLAPSLRRQGRTSHGHAEGRLGEVFELSYRKLVVQLYAVVGDAAEAEDLVQEAFVRASLAGRRFAGVANPEAWLRTTALNLHRNRWRKRLGLTRLRPAPRPPQDLPGMEDHLVVVEALRRLPEQHREVLVLHYLADLPVTEVAGVLGIAEGTVKSRLHRARTSLGALIEEGNSHV